ncbi:MAG TPA: response regulator [Vineibacter sp.]|nr:response regulator [Vineibacter sp.]
MEHHVYIVDDDEAVRDSLRALFEAHGFVVHDFASAVAFLDRYAPTMRGCLVLDVNLPGLDGMVVLRCLTASGSQLPVILMTARSDSAASASALAAGVIGFVQKPFVSAQLMSLVDGALRR